MDPAADPSPSRRSLKRRPPARSPELSPKAGGGDPVAAAEELIRRVEELEAAAAALRGEKEAAEEAARGLLQELDAERASTETAASEARLPPARRPRLHPRRPRLPPICRRRREAASYPSRRAA